MPTQTFNNVNKGIVMRKWEEHYQIKFVTMEKGGGGLIGTWYYKRIKTGSTMHLNAEM